MTKELHGPRPDHTLTTIRAKEREPSEKARLSLFWVSGAGGSRARPEGTLCYAKNPHEGETSRGRNISGAGGSRTLVQTGKPYAFYTLIPDFGFRVSARPGPPTDTLAPKFSSMHRSLHGLFPI